MSLRFSAEGGLPHRYYQEVSLNPEMAFSTIVFSDCKNIKNLTVDYACPFSSPVYFLNFCSPSYIG